jgi:tetratricopeptide (TPR) repeat protein
LSNILLEAAYKGLYRVHFSNKILDEAIRNRVKRGKMNIEAKWRSVAFDWRGYIYYRAKEYSKSLYDLTEAINLVPNEVEYLTDRGKTYLWMKYYDKALEDFNRAIEID